MRFLGVLLLLAISVGFPSQGQYIGSSLGNEVIREGCDKGWLQFGNNYYFFNHDKKGQANWNEAKQVCHLLGGHLIDIRTEDERQFVKSHLRAAIDDKYDQYLIGMTDAASEGHWKYTDGTDVTYFKWKTNEPNGGTKENCGAIFSSTTIGRYNDGPCTHKYGRFICKKGTA